MAKVAGAPSPKPSDLTGPVPGAVEADEFEAFLDSVPAPDLSSPTPASTGPQATEVDDFDQMLASSPDSGAALAPSSASDMSPLEAPRHIYSIKEQLREVGARFKNAFAVTNVESLQVLKDTGLFEDVRVGSGGEIEVKRPGRKGFEKFDRDKLELIGDTVDFARDLFEGVIEGTTEVGATVGLGMVGTAMGGPAGGILSGTAGNIAGGAAGAVAAKNAGDFVAEQILGIKVDPGRNKASENALAAAFGAGFTWLGSRAARASAKEAAKVTGVVNKLERVQSKMAQANELVRTVNESGINLGDGKFKLDVQQVMGKGKLPEADVRVGKVLETDAFQNFRETQGEVLNDAIDSVAKHMGSLTRGGKELGEDFVLSGMDIRRAEGKLIQDYRKFARQELVGQPVPAPRTSQLMQNLTADPQLMINEKTGRLMFNPNEAVTDLSDAQAKAYVNFLNKVMVPLRKNQGGMSVDAAQDLYEQLSKEINRNISTDHGRAYAYRLIDLKNSIRDDWTDMIGQILPDDMMKEYATSKAAYSDIMKSFDTLSAELKQSDISAEALANSIFSKGKQGLAKARAAKVLFQSRDPKMWQQLTGQYVNTMMNNAWDPAKEAFDFVKMRKQWQGLGPQMQMEILNGSGIKPEGLTALFTLGSKYQRVPNNYTPTEADVKQVSKVTLALVGRVSDVMREQVFSKIMSGIGKDEIIMNWLQDGGMNLVEKELRGKMKPSMLKQLNNAVMKYGTSRPAKTMIRREIEDEK